MNQKERHFFFTQAKVFIDGPLTTFSLHKYSIVELWGKAYSR